MPAHHITYTGASKPIRRLTDTVNQLIDNGGGGGSANCRIDEIIPMLEAVQAGISATTTFSARVENNILYLEGTGVSVSPSGNLILNSRGVSVTDNVLYL